jgi:hypothetical protein
MEEFTMKTLQDAFRYRQVGPPPRSTRSLMQRFDHAPHDSVTALLRKAGPFQAERDGYVFTNTDWPITEEDAQVLRQRYQGLIDAVSLGSALRKNHSSRKVDKCGTVFA